MAAILTTKNVGSQKEKLFEEEAKKLNSDQRRAIDTIEGPVMVVAGPGSGKTQVIALRVANILRRTHATPRNILCLTFSMSGATAMRERLRKIIGADAYGVTVDTIHGFCNDIILGNPILFEEWETLERISDVERFRTVNRILDALLPDLAIVNPKNPYRRTAEILSRISQVKREGKTLEDLENIAGISEQELLGKSKPGTKANERNIVTARKYREFIEVFRRYTGALQESQRYDYDDMILRVIEALKSEEWLLMSLQERYQYVLVDEFQDTNGAQNALIELLTTYPTVSHDPNLFVVGDDDQAIYRFQGANLQNILTFHRRFPEGQMIVLGTSYRCSQGIIDAAGCLIAENEERLVGRIPGLRKDLQAANTQEEKLPRLLCAPSDTAEPWIIADECEKKAKEGTPLREIAILTQTNAELHKYAEVLRARGIPVRMAGKVDLLVNLSVLQLLAILECVGSPSDSTKLAAALSCACFDCHPADLGRLFMEKRKRECSLLELLLTLDQPEWELQLLNVERLRETRNLLLDLHQKCATRTVVQTVERAMKDTGLLKNPEKGDPLEFGALQAFFEYVKQRAYESPTYGLDQLLSDMELYRNPEYGDLRLRYELPHLTQNGVQLLTAHQSKGLEFDVVILPNFREGHWDRRRNPPSLTLPEDLLFGWKKDVRSFEQSQDERRVAYVAMTRARKELIFTYGKEQTVGEKTRSASPSGFFAQCGELPEEERSPLDPMHCSLLLMNPVRNIDEEFRAFLQERLKTFTLSVTALNHFLDDPRKFLEMDLLQMPQSKEANLVYGNAVHAALRSWGLSTQRGTPMNVEETVGEFRRYLREREVLTEKERERLLVIGKEALPRYYAERLEGRNPSIFGVEKGISAFLPLAKGWDEGRSPSLLRRGEGALKEEIPIKGLLDRIDREHPDSSRVRIIDYKTGRPKTESQIRDGDYYRQLVFYAVLIEQAHLPLEPTAFILDFIGEREDAPVERVFTISQQDREDLKKVIRDVWTKVTNLDFTPL